MSKYTSQLETELTALTARLAEVERERDGFEVAFKAETKNLLLIRQQRDTLAADNERLKSEVLKWCRAYFDGAETSHIALIRIESLTKGGDEPCAK